MGAGLQRDICRRAPRRAARLRKRDGLGMGAPARLGPAAPADTAIQNACYRTLVAFAGVDSGYVITKARAARAKHRSPDLLDKLVGEAAIL